MRDAEHLSDFINAVTTGIDYLFTSDVTMSGVYDEFATSCSADLFHWVEAIDFGTGFSRLSGERKSNT